VSAEAKKNARLWDMKGVRLGAVIGKKTPEGQRKRGRGKSNVSSGSDRWDVFVFDKEYKGWAETGKKGVIQ